MKKKDSNIEIAFALLEVKIDQFAILENNFNPKKEIGLSTNIQFKLAEEDKMLGCFLELEFLQVKKVFLKIAVSCHFKIDDTSWLSLINESQSSVKIPKDFLAHIAMITVGASRGALTAKAELTLFSNIIVPIMNVAEMLPEDAVFELINE